MGFEEFQNSVATRKRDLGDVLSSVLDGETSIVFEAGCGHGHWLTEYAAAHPTQVCLGIDMIGDRVNRANRKKERAGLSNVSFVRGEAYETLELLPKEIRFSSLFLLFLDPWPKKRHWKNRLFCLRFLEEAAGRSLEGTRLHFRTDHEGYFKWAQEVAAESEWWAEDPSIAWPFERETVFQAKADSFRSMILVRE